MEVVHILCKPVDGNRLQREIEGDSVSQRSAISKQVIDIHAFSVHAKKRKREQCCITKPRYHRCNCDCRRGCWETELQSKLCRMVQRGIMPKDGWSFYPEGIASTLDLYASSTFV
jgi:hypothetical protein